MKQHLDILCNEDSDSDAVDSSLAALQVMVRDGLPCQDIIERCKDSLTPSSGRALCLEALAGARAKSRVGDVVVIIRLFLSAEERDLVFQAIACASDLPKANQQTLVPEIKMFTGFDDYLGRAARCFCGQKGIL